MNTGTPLDLTPFGSVLHGIGLLYWLLVALILAAVVTNAQGRMKKWLSAAVVLGIMVGPIAWDMWKKHEARQQAKARLDVAMALFHERCKSAGEKIYRTVDDVDGVVWMKWRTQINLSDQFKLDDPYGQDCLGDECILKLLRVTKGESLNPHEASRHEKGYRFVETIDPSDGMLYRYIGVLKLSWAPQKIEQYRNSGIEINPNNYYFALERQHIEKYTARYGITWNDISTYDDRKAWIAGGSLKIIDLQANNVIAERSGFLIDPGQGSTAGFRDPWGWAKSHSTPCPQEHEDVLTFATKVLHPSK